MKLPHSLFVLVNLVMLGILRSPLHGVFSGSVFALTYRGRKSGKRRTVPARYLREGDTLFAVTSKDTGWWPNFRDKRAAEVRIKGAVHSCMVTAVADDPILAEQTMRKLWSRHPSDAAYMDVPVRNGRPDPEVLAQAAVRAVVVRIEL